jgi:signal transduction histidine kinase
MLSWISIRWRITLFHILTMLCIAVLLMIGMFAVFGIAVSNSVEEAARSRANEAARLIEHSGTLSEADLVELNRDSVVIVAIDDQGQVVAQIGSGLLPGAQVDPEIWAEVAETGESSSVGQRSVFDSWNDSADYTHIEPIAAGDSGIAFVAASVNYDNVGQQQYMWVTFAFVGFGLVAFILITIGSIYLVRYSLAPVNAIAEAASQISEADLSQRLPVRSRRDELGKLAQTFNAMLDRLESAFNDREEALAQQRRFVADASHELRTPLTSLLGYTRMLRKWGLERPDASEEALARMEAEGKRMQSMVESLLHLARTDEANALEFEQVDLATIVDSAVEPLRAGDEEAAIDFERFASPVMVRANREAIVQVLGILLDNALKHSPPGSPVRVGLSKNGGRAVIEVRDQGPGIAPEHLPHIFDRFYRVETSRSTRGAGLGLAIAKDLVERHRGTISVSSTPGQGAVFEVCLPAMEAAPAPIAGGVDQLD